MSVWTKVMAGAEEAVLWDDGRGQQVLGPEVARIAVDEEPELAGGPYRLNVDVELLNGRYVINGVEIVAQREQRITSSALQAIRLPEIVRRGLTGRLKVSRKLASGDTVYGMGPAEELPAVYVLAWAIGENPTVAVAEHFEIGRSAAAQRVARARQQGLLPPTTKGAR